MKRRYFSLKMPSGYSKLIHAMVLVLNFFGVLMIISANMTTSATTMSIIFAGVKELGFVVASYIAMVFFARNFSMEWFKKHYLILLILMLGLLGVTRLFPSAGGAYAWIRVGPMTLQPSEFAKVFVILMIALWLGDRKKVRIKSAFDLLKHPLTVVLVMVAYIVLVQKDLGSAVVILGITYICMLIPVHNRLSKLQMVMLVLLIFGLFMLIFISTESGLAFVERILGLFNASPYMLARFHSSANPFLERYGDSYQLFNSLVAFVTGGFWGVGFGNGFIKYSYLPEAETDFILAIIVEELGMIGFGIIFIGYAVILYQLFRNALISKSEKSKVILMGAVAYLMIHFIFNVGGVTALIPLTGVPLLFMSAGGSSRLAIMILIGISQSVIAHNTRSNRKKDISV